MFYSLYYVRIPEICGRFPSMGTCCATYFGVSVLIKKEKTMIVYTILRSAVSVGEKIIKGLLF